MTEPTTGWQRLAPRALVVLFVSGLLRWGRQNLTLLLGAGAGLAWLERIGLREALLLAVSIGLLAALLSLLYFRRFRFRLDNDVLLLQKGLFQRSEIRLSAARVQHIGLEQPLYMRPLGVVRLRIDTPGGESGNVELPGIRRAVAEQLRQALVTQHGPADSEPAVPGQPPLFRIDPAALTLHGLASNQAYLLAAALTPFMEPLMRAARRHIQAIDQWAWLRAAAEAPVLSAAVGLTALVLLLATISVAATWLRYWDFTLVREGERIIQRSGLFSRQEQALTLGKLQSVDWVQTAVGRALGRGYILCRQFGTPQGNESVGGNFLIPGLDRSQGSALAGSLWPGVVAEADFQRVHPYYRRALLLRLGLTIWLAASLAGAFTGGYGWLIGALVGSALLYPLVYLRWLAIGWHSQGRYTLVRRGLLGRRTTIFPAHSVQAVQLQQSWFQRRRGLATLRLTLASGTVTIPYLDHGQALQLADTVLYRVEHG